MKHARKLTSLLLALVMVFALAVTVAAEETTGTTGTGSITVVNPIAGRDYTAYKIFDVVYDAPTATGHYSYTIKSGDGGSPWFSTVETYATPDNGLTLTQVEGTNTYVVTFDKDKFSAPAFAEALKKALADNSVTDTGKQLAKSETSASVNNLDLGYYFVKSNETDALCNLTTTNPNANIHDKNNVPFEKKKTVDNNDFKVGDTVPFTITGKVPDHTGFKTYTYLITDTMSKGLTFNETSVQVKVGDDVLTAGDATYTLATGGAADDYTFKVTIYVKNYAVGLPIEVAYTATINENAVAKISTNKAELTYSNDPTDESKTGKIPSEDVKVYTSKIAIEKIEKLADGATATPKKLDGAQFVLYKEETPKGGTTATKLYYKWNDTDASNKKVEWIADKNQATVKETGKDGNPGAASFDGLANGTYYLVETKAPAGYNQLTAPVTVTVNGGTAEANLTVTERVENQAGTLLPSTGGMGTTVFYVLGAVLVVGAGVLLVTKKRMSQSDI